MDPNVLETLFSPFHQADQTLTRSRGGLGIGLALAKGLVVLHEGEIAATSDGAGRGSEITIRLPLAERPSSRPDLRLVEAAPQRKRTHRVLVIEDNPDAALSLKVLLEHAGHIVETAATGAAGVTAAARFAPDVVLCDIGLPVMDGYSVARALRQQPGMGDAYLIALTGYGQAADQTRAREAGFDRHVTKPVHFEELEKLLESRGA
jgi:CheY-like chemotaxis protein